MSTATRLITAEEYARMPDMGVPTELVRGEIVELNQPGFRHGKVCSRAVRLLGNFADERELGHVVSNDTGIITETDPDTVRGGDVWFISYQKLPKDAEEPSGYLDVLPDIVIEVLSPSNTRSTVLTKLGEYLAAGVPVVCVLDPSNMSAHVYRPDQPDVVLKATEDLTFPDVLPGFCVKVREFFAG